MPKIGFDDPPGISYPDDENNLRTLSDEDTTLKLRE